ncbi:hypothetical protein J7643_19405 [bacterium]|nr:hypothetical protein [bacterium]
MNERKPAKTPRTPKTEGTTAPKRRRKAVASLDDLTLRHGEIVLELNPGQASLIRTLSREFSSAFLPSASDAELELDPSKPDLVSFLMFELEALSKRQRALAALYAS